jgi:hypothetical protein
MILSPNGLNSDVVYPRGSWNPAMTRGLVLPRECHHQTFRPMTADMEIVCEQLCSCPCCFCFLSVLSNCHARPADSSTNELEDIIGNWHDSFHLGLREAPPRERSTGWRKVPAAGDFPAWDLYQCAQPLRRHAFEEIFRRQSRVYHVITPHLLPCLQPSNSWYLDKNSASPARIESTAHLFVQGYVPAWVLRSILACLGKHMYCSSIPCLLLPISWAVPHVI